MRFKSRRRRTSGMYEVSLTPLIDTALTLLIIFMVATPVMQSSLKIRLPEGKTGQSTPLPPKLVVYVNEQNQIFFNGELVTVDTIENAIRPALGEQTDATIFVQADKHVSYGRVMALVLQIKKCEGIQQVALSTKQA